MVKRYQAPVIAHTDFVLASDYDKLAERFERAKNILGNIADAEPGGRVAIRNFLDRVTQSDAAGKL